MSNNENTTTATTSAASTTVKRASKTVKQWNLGTTEIDKNLVKELCEEFAGEGRTAALMVMPEPAMVSIILKIATDSRFTKREIIHPSSTVSIEVDGETLIEEIPERVEIVTVDRFEEASKAYWVERSNPIPRELSVEELEAELNRFKALLEAKRQG